MQNLELKGLKNKSKLIASLSWAEHVALQSYADINEILDKLNRLKRAVLFENINAIKELAQDLRAGQRSGGHPSYVIDNTSHNEYVGGFEKLIDSINAATHHCIKTKLVVI